MTVNEAPLFATILCRWLGKLAMPIGDAFSALEGAIVCELHRAIHERKGLLSYQ
jgi:hypothetical protein